MENYKFGIVVSEWNIDITTNLLKGAEDKLIEFVNPKLCFIAIDGVAPAAKMGQQRLRRFKTVLEREEQNKIRNNKKKLAK